jgi:hypothetical protein
LFSLHYMPLCSLWTKDPNAFGERLAHISQMAALAVFYLSICLLMQQQLPAPPACSGDCECGSEVTRAGREPTLVYANRITAAGWAGL